MLYTMPYAFAYLPYARPVVLFETVSSLQSVRIFVSTLKFEVIFCTVSIEGFSCSFALPNVRFSCHYHVNCCHPSTYPKAAVSRCPRPSVQMSPDRSTMNNGRCGVTVGQSSINFSERTFSVPGLTSSQISHPLLVLKPSDKEVPVYAAIS